MTDSLPTLSDWSKGANNQHSGDRLPGQYMRGAINLDPLPSGKLAMRSGYSKVVAGINMRGALALGDLILLADGADLALFDTRTSSVEILRSIVDAGPFAGTVHNNELFFCTASESLRFDGATVRTWGVPTPSLPPLPAIGVGGALLAGQYLFSITHVNAEGEEGGAALTRAFAVGADNAYASFTIPEPPAGCRTRLYVSKLNSTTPYFQEERAAASTVVLTRLRDDTARLVTEHKQPPPPGQLVASFNGVLLIADGKTVWITDPLSPHLVSRAKRFFTYPKPVTVLLAVKGGVYVGADRVYWLTAADTDQPAQIAVHGAVAPVPGTGALSKKHEALWMTRYGPMLGDEFGAVRALSEDHFVPDVTNEGASGIVERGGLRLGITTMRGVPEQSELATGDYFTGRAIDP